MDVLTPSLDTTQPTIAALHAESIRILADDLTGACDSAAAFLACGSEVRVWLGEVATEETNEPVQAFNTASRELAVGFAAEVVSRAARALPTNEKTLWFKKIDSAGRGPIAAEVLAAHRSLGTRAILFAPSFPHAGRTVRDGILQVEDASGLSSQIPLGVLFQGVAATVHISHAGQINKAIASGAEVLICDAATPADLDALAQAEEPGLLYAGSAGLARALARVRPTVSQPHNIPRGLRTMTICGSPHRVTAIQMDHLEKALPAHPRLQVCGEDGDSAMALEAFERLDPGTLILTGGDTALVALTALRAHSILLRGELADGIPWGEIQGGVAHGRIVITKSGGFGVADSLTRIVRHLTGETTA